MAQAPGTVTMGRKDTAGHRNLRRFKPLKDKLKKFLFVTYDFPPRRTSAVYRRAAWAKYLPQYGWMPTVLTIETKSWDTVEPELIKKIPPEVKVVRTDYWRINAWESGAARSLRIVGGLQSHYNAPNQSRRDRWVRSLGGLVRAALYFPDDTAGWIPIGLRKALELHSEHRFDLVYSVGPPRSAPQIGLLMKVLKGVPWVVDYEDPWYPSPRPIRRWFERRLEATMLKHADAVVVMTQALADELSRFYRIPLTKFSVSGCGYDEEDFLPIQACEQEFLEPGFVHLNHFGTIYPQNSGRFFPALLEFMVENPEAKDRLRVNMFGFPGEAVGRYADEPALKGILRNHGYLKDRETILRLTCSSDWLLLFWARPDFSRFAVAGKIYDYLRAGRPIYAVASEGRLKEIVETAHAGWVFHPDDVEGMKRGLGRILKGLHNEDTPRTAPREYIEQFRLDHLAAELAAVFDTAVSHAK